MKKKAVKKSAKPKRAVKAKARPKAQLAKKKTSAKPKAAKKAAKKATSPKAARPAKAPKESHGLTVIDLFKMKQQREQQALQDPEAWKHKKDLPAQDQHNPDDTRPVATGKKSGFGGARHH